MKPSNTTSNLLFGLVGLIALAATLAGGALLASGTGAASAGRAGAGGALAGAGLLGLFVWLTAAVCRSWITKSAVKTSGTVMETVAALQSELHRVNEQLAVISRQQLLTDRAKAVAYRSNDRKAMLDAINEECGRGDYEAALALVDDMERAFGNMAEAERARREIDRSREVNELAAIRSVRERLEAFTSSERWTDALDLARQTAASFPHSLIAGDLVSDVEAQRTALKQKLIAELRACAAANDAENGARVLERLDRYLSTDEASGLRESVRNLFVTRIHSLKDSFAAAVKAADWRQAIRLAEHIIREFPSSKLAGEVAAMVDSLKERAAEAEGAAASVSLPV